MFGGIGGGVGGVGGGGDDGGGVGGVGGDGLGDGGGGEIGGAGGCCGDPGGDPGDVVALSLQSLARLCQPFAAMNPAGSHLLVARLKVFPEMVGKHS